MIQEKEFIFIQSGSFEDLVNDWENHKNDLICAVGFGPWARDYKRFLKFTEYLETCKDKTLVCVLFYSKNLNELQTFDICHFDIEKQKFEQISHDLKVYYDKQYILISTIKRGFIY